MDLDTLRALVALAAVAVVAELVVLGTRFGYRLVRDHRGTAMALVGPPVAIGAFGLAGVLGSFAWATWSSLGEGPPAAVPPARMWIYLVSLTAIGTSIVWTGYAQRALASRARAAEAAGQARGDRPRTPGRREPR